MHNKLLITGKWLKVDEDEQFHAINVIHRGHILHYPIVRKHF